MRVILAAVLALTAAPALAADWVEVAKSNDGRTAVEADAETIRRDGSAVVVWTRVNRKGGGYFIAHHAINCAMQTYRDNRVLAYSASGDSTDLTEGSDLQWKSPVPDSMMAIAVRNICKGSDPE